MCFYPPTSSPSSSAVARRPDLTKRRGDIGRGGAPLLLFPLSSHRMWKRVVLFVQPPLSGSIYGGGKHGGRDRGTPPKARKENGSFPREMIGKKKAEGGGRIWARSRSAVVLLLYFPDFGVGRGKNMEKQRFLRGRGKGETCPPADQRHTFHRSPFFALASYYPKGRPTLFFFCRTGKERVWGGGRDSTCEDGPILPPPPCTSVVVVVFLCLRGESGPEMQRKKKEEEERLLCQLFPFL